MSGDRKRDGTRQTELVCGSCRQPVETVVERHKTMGINVPHWRAGPCHNPDCEAYVPELVPADTVRPDAGRRTERPAERREMEAGPPA
ncbi:hypothetical protein ACIRG8_17560 [Streptomyces sp. NPDC102359]|uniref:hypothetical protein n=1 Tax=unclassified Streptomyces TaxID=2593676 RepID=UPI0038006C32